VIVSLFVAFLVCLLLLVAVSLFTMTPVAQRIDEREPRRRARLD
jgi:hypothetical protein